VSEKVVERGSFGMEQSQRRAKEVKKLKGEAILEELHVEYDFGWVYLLLLQLLLPIRPFQQVRLRVNEAADVVTFNYLLPILTEHYLQYLMQRVRLLIVLKSSDRALEYDQPQFEYIEGAFGLEVGGLGNGALHEVLLGHVHLEDAESDINYLVFCGVLMWYIELELLLLKW
jgi:hypothetical protein